ncbi:MAG: replication initiation protein [Lentisphaerae bacterium]|nr:replication initiation protein [Lentisphaerota bacterium]
MSKTSKRKKYAKSSIETAIPQVWGKNPIFAATKLKESREVVISDGTIWTMGVQPPFGEITNPEYLRGFDVRHAEVIFRLLAFFRDNDIDFNHKIDISYYKLLELIGWERSQKSLKVLKEILADLSSIWTQISTDNDRAFQFRVLSASVDRDLHNPDSGHLRYIVFDQTFLEFLGDIEQFFSIRLDVFNGLSSKIAKAIYLYLPSRALKNSKKSPFKMTLTNLFNQINIKVPKYKSERHRKMVQHGNPMSQLNNALINFKQKLCVSLDESKDKKDYNLCAWTEELSDNDICIDREQSLKTWFINGRRGTGRDFDNKIRKLPELNTYEISALELSQIDVEASKIFLLMSKTLLGETCFDELCGTVKNSTLEGKVNNPTAYFISLVRSELLGDELPLF